MSWLAELLSDFISSLVIKLKSYFDAKTKQKQADAASQTAANESIAPLQTAKTSGDIDEAAKSSLNGV